MENDNVTQKTFHSFTIRSRWPERLQAIDSDDLTRSYFAKYYNKSSPSTDATSPAASTSITRWFTLFTLSDLSINLHSLENYLDNVPVFAVYPIHWIPFKKKVYFVSIFCRNWYYNMVRLSAMVLAAAEATEHILSISMRTGSSHSIFCIFLWRHLFHICFNSTYFLSFTKGSTLSSNCCYVACFGVALFQNVILICGWWRNIVWDSCRMQCNDLNF